MNYFKFSAAIGLAALVSAHVDVAAADTKHHTPYEMSPAAAPTVTGGTNNGATCKVSFYTSTTSLTPPDNLVNLASSPNSYLAGGASALKPCSGNVVIFFSSEISTQGSGDFIHAFARATCVATGGLSGACTPGTVVNADPGQTVTTYMETNQVANLATHSATWVVPNLARGQWRFEVLVGGSGNATNYVGYRTVVVEMFGS